MKTANQTPYRNHPWISLGLAVLAGLSLASPGWGSSGDNELKGRQQLEKTLQAHGGLSNWQRYGSLAYTMKGFPLTGQTAKPNRSTVDLKTRTNRIEGPDFVVGFDGTRSWSTPGPKSTGLPTRFFSLGSFYFVGIPFVLADPGVKVAWDGQKPFQGKNYNVLNVTFTSGVGHSDKDNYQVYIDPSTNRVALINHNVTEIYDEKTRVTWVYDAYIPVGNSGLVLPSKLAFYQGWSENPDPKQGASYTVDDYEAGTARPEVSLYQAPQGASINDQ